MLSIDKLNDHPLVITSTIPWIKEAMTILNVIVINLHTRLGANLYRLAFQLIICYITGNNAKFLLPYFCDLARFFTKSITRYFNLLLTTLTTTSSLLICWCAVANIVIVSDKFEIWPQSFQKSESTVSFPLQLIIDLTRSAFFNALIALSDKLNNLIDGLLSIIMLLNVLTSPQKEEKKLKNLSRFASTTKKTVITLQVLCSSNNAIFLI